MKRLLAGLFVATVINMPDDAMIAIIPIACADGSTGTRCAPCVLQSTGAVFVIPSTGPVRMKSDATGDCYEIPFILPNGTCGTTKYIKCQ